MDTFFENVSSDILKYTITYHEKIVCKILDENAYINEPQRFFYTIIHKVNSTLSSANFFIRNSHTHNEWKISIYILFRSIMADLIIGEYVIHSAPTDELKKELIFKIYADHITRIYKSVDSYGVIENFTEKEKLQFKSDLIKQNPKFFDDLGNPVKSETVSIDKIIRKIFSLKQKTDNYLFLKRAYNYYDYFSKYEHLGSLSFPLTFKIYDNLQIKTDYSEIYECVNICFSALTNYCKGWDFFSDEMLVLNDLHQQFLNNTPDKIPGA